VRVLLSTYGSRGDVEPLAGLAVRLRGLGAEVRVCAPPDCAERLAGVGVPLVPVGARAGAPQVVIPQWADQPYWAGRLAGLGIGTEHDGPAPTTESPVSRAHDRPDPRDPHASDRRGRPDPHRRGDGGRDAAARRGQPGKAASARVNHAGSPSQDPEHENLPTLAN
jgi:hypothetical protein